MKSRDSLEVKKLGIVNYLNSEAPDSYRDKLLNSEATQHLNDSPIKQLNDI